MGICFLNSELNKIVYFIIAAIPYLISLLWAEGEHEL
jgi:hypothetical protein